MQYAVGAPLPPPRGPLHTPGAAMSWTPHHGQPLPPGSPPAPAGPPPAAPPAPASPAHGAPGPGWPAPAPHQAPPTQHSTDITGHVQLPPGAPVPLPSPPADTAAPDAAHAAVAVLLIGPAGAGKTSVARHWADTRRVPTAHISLDDVREWVRSGFADPQSGWNDNSEAQYRLARRTCGFAARNFLANGISCILDDAVFPDRPVVGLGGWKRHVGPGLLPIVLLPGLEIVLERNARRTGNRRLSDEEVARIHGRMAGWYGSGLPIIDNSQHDVATTAGMLDDVVARSIASPPSW
ncbi:Pro-rich N-terminal domain-containing protein [Streptomyces sp. CT34]|uniref:Pro-rich N-terminal domain-containing protein n=1 Tax=Streptomyces sp. CT34 TaxID=1553907 RepID=UPI0005BCE6E0|nr:Pro-rich N-terminal domain-containing protein [Streptomyces sp. CT34]